MNILIKLLLDALSSYLSFASSSSLSPSPSQLLIHSKIILILKIFRSFISPSLSPHLLFLVFCISSLFLPAYSHPSLRFMYVESLHIMDELSTNGFFSKVHLGLSYFSLYNNFLYFITFLILCMITGHSECVL